MKWPMKSIWVRRACGNNSSSSNTWMGRRHCLDCVSQQCLRFTLTSLVGSAFVLLKPQWSGETMNTIMEKATVDVCVSFWLETSSWIILELLCVCLFFSMMDYHVDWASDISAYDWLSNDLIPSLTSRTTHVYVPMGGVQRSRLALFGDALNGLSRILHLCKVRMGKLADHVPHGCSRLINISRRWGWARYLPRGWPDKGPSNESVSLFS